MMMILGYRRYRWELVFWKWFCLVRDLNYLVFNNRYIFCSDGLEIIFGMEVFMELMDGLDGWEWIDYYFIDGGFDVDLRFFILLCLLLLSGLSGIVWCLRILLIFYFVYEFFLLYFVLVFFCCFLLWKYLFWILWFIGFFSVFYCFVLCCNEVGGSGVWLGNLLRWYFYKGVVGGWYKKKENWGRGRCNNSLRCKVLGYKCYEVLWFWFFISIWIRFNGFCLDYFFWRFGFIVCESE